MEAQKNKVHEYVFLVHPENLDKVKIVQRSSLFASKKDVIFFQSRIPELKIHNPFLDTEPEDEDKLAIQTISSLKRQIEHLEEENHKLRTIIDKA